MKIDYLYLIDEQQNIRYRMVRTISVTGYELGKKDGKVEIRNR